MTGKTDTRPQYTKEQRAQLDKTYEFVKEKLSQDSTGHDWWHIERVRRNALLIAQSEAVDCFVVELGALLHDIADWKFNGGDLTEAPRVAAEWLSEIGVDSEVIDHVCDIIANVSFKGAKVKTPMRTREGLVVQDADRLDALGAVGIARTFAYGGHANRSIYEPDVPPEEHASFEQYKSSRGHTINHFYEKLLLIKDRLNTKSARAIAEERHRFMEAFLDRFFDEWNGKA
jgi:uncharacterized protein